MVGELGENGCGALQEWLWSLVRMFVELGENVCGAW